MACNSRYQICTSENGVTAIVEKFDIDGNVLGTVHTPESFPAEFADWAAFLASIMACKCGAVQCWKDKFIEGGLDNTFTKFTDTNAVIAVGFSDGTSGVINIPSATDFTDQINQMAVGLDAIMPWAQTVDPFCTNACGGLPAPFVTVPQMKFRYVGFRVCPGNVTPETAEYTSDQVKKPIKLVIKYVETPTIYIDRCVDCDGNETNLIKGTKTPYEPVCAIPCHEEFPAIPEPACDTQYFEGWCDVSSSGDPDIDDTVNENGTIIVAVTTCGADQTVQFLILDGTALVPYTPIGSIVNCETGVAFEPEPPPCPEGAVFVCGEYEKSYFIFDNSNWIGAPKPHITNGFNFEFTFTRADGSTDVWQQSADPLFNNFISTAPAAIGCKVIPVCANHTSPNGCHPAHVANLAAYPAYDAPTAPADIQNNLTNPDQAELWASGWLIDCADCKSPIVRVEITAANDAAYIGAYKVPIAHSEKVKVSYANTCDGVFWKDCKGNAIVAPTDLCCVAPCPVEVKTALDAALTECCDTKPVTYTNSDDATEMTVSVGGNGEIKIGSGSGDGSDDPITAYITACLAAGNDCAITFEFEDGHTGSATLLHAAQTNAFPNFYNQSTNATTTQPNGVGKVTKMTATCAGECKPALRNVGCNDGTRDTLLTAILAAVSVDWRPACLTDGSTFQSGWIQFDKVTGLDSTVVKLDNGAVSTTAIWSQADTCECCKDCSSPPCPKLIIGDTVDSADNSTLSYPMQIAGGFLNWVVPVSIETGTACLDDNPNASITVRICFDHEALVYDNHRAFVLVASAGTFTAVSASNTQAAASGTGAQQIGYGVGDNVNGPRAIRCADLTLTVAQLQAGITFSGLAFGGVGGASEAIYSMDIEIVDGLTAICEGC